MIAKILNSTLHFNGSDGDHGYSSLNKLDTASATATGPAKPGNAFHSLDSRLATRSQHSNATFIQFAEGLMNSIERILLLADWLVVLAIRRNIVKVVQSLNDMDARGTDNFQTFMHLFSRFGADMVELGEISGQRQLVSDCGCVWLCVPLSHWISTVLP